MAFAIDTFNRTSLQTNWTVVTGFMLVQGDGAPPNGVTSSSLYSTGSFLGTANGENIALRNTPTFSSNHFSQITIRELIGTGKVGVAVRANATGAYTFTYDGTAWSASAYSNNWTLQAADSGTITASAGDALRMDVNGTDLFLYHNEVMFKNISTWNYLTNGQPGINVYGSSLTFRGSDWIGGNLPYWSAVDAFTAGDVTPNWTTTLPASAKFYTAFGWLVPFNTNVDTFVVWNSGSPSFNQYSKLSMNGILSQSNYAALGVLTRYTSSNGSSSGYLLYTDGTSGSHHTTLYKLSGAIGFADWVELESYNTSYNSFDHFPPDSLTYGSGSDELELRVVGIHTASLSAYKNGIQIGSTYHDISNPFLTGRPGVYGYAQGGAACRIETWYGGDIQVPLLATIATDDFNRANNLSLGGYWAVPANSDSPQIINSRALGSGGVAFNSFAYWVSNSFGADQYAKCRNSSPDHAANRFVYLGVRMGGNNGEGYYLATDGVVTNIGYVDTTNTYNEIETLSASFAGTDVMEIHAVGSTISAYKNGVQIGTNVTHTAIISGSPGLAFTDNNSFAEDFEGGIIIDYPLDASHIFNEKTTLRSMILRSARFG